MLIKLLKVPLQKLHASKGLSLSEDHSLSHGARAGVHSHISPSLNQRATARERKWMRQIEEQKEWNNPI